MNQNQKCGNKSAVPRQIGTALGALALVNALTSGARADGVLRDGAGAQSMALGGTSVAAPNEPLEAMYENPAGLGFFDRPEVQLGGVAGFVQGNFSNSANHNSSLSQVIGGFPEAALVVPLKSAPLSLGLSVMPDAFSRVDWRFEDAPGGLGGNTSYGLQRNYAEFIAIRTAVGLGWKISDTLSLGADVGVDYDRNHLNGPYVFQSYAPLRGFKTLLDLQTQGWGVNGTLGLVWHPVEKVSVGLSYRSMTYFDTHGTASGNAGTQLQNIGAGSFPPGFNYNAEVDTKLPQSVAAGASWQALDWMRLIGEVDWINWQNSFDHLNIKLSQGSNGDINSFLGTSHFEYTAPLDWKNSFVYRAGLEFPFAEHYVARLGYAFGANPVPAATLTPMSAAILENTFTCGLEWHNDRWSIAAAYQYDLPSTENVGKSDLASGEFSNSSTTVDSHLFALTIGLKF